MIMVSTIIMLVRLVTVSTIITLGQHILESLKCIQNLPKVQLLQHSEKTKYLSKRDS